MPHWQNAALTKCHIDKMPHWQNAGLTKCRIDKMPCWQNVALTKCQGAIFTETLDGILNFSFLII
jgi:hypothetical protein